MGVWARCAPARPRTWCWCGMLNTPLCFVSLTLAQNAPPPLLMPKGCPHTFQWFKCQPGHVWKLEPVATRFRTRRRLVFATDISHTHILTELCMRNRPGAFQTLDAFDVQNLPHSCNGTQVSTASRGTTELQRAEPETRLDSGQRPAMAVDCRAATGTSSFETDRRTGPLRRNGRSRRDS